MQHTKLNLQSEYYTIYYTIKSHNYTLTLKLISINNIKLEFKDNFIVTNLAHIDRYAPCVASDEAGVVSGVAIVASGVDSVVSCWGDAVVAVASGEAVVSGLTVVAVTSSTVAVVASEAAVVSGDSVVAVTSSTVDVVASNAFVKTCVVASLAIELGVAVVAASEVGLEMRMTAMQQNELLKYIPHKFYKTTTPFY